MPIPVQCVHCSSRFKVPDEAAGRIAKCPKCGNRITIDPPPVIVVPPEHVAEAEQESSSNSLVIGIAVAVVTCVLLALGWLVFFDRTGSPPVATAGGQPEVTPEPPEVQAKPPESAPVEPRSPEVEPEPEPIQSQPGFGLTLDQFKRDVPIGDSWKVLSENEHENGRVSFQLLSTTMRNVMLMVSGNPDDLREVSFTFSATNDMSEGDTLSRFAVMVLFLSKYSDWTEEELGQFWQRLLQVGAGEETDFKIQKNDHTFWMTPMGVKDGTMFITGVSVDPESDAPTLRQWLDAHPVPAGAGLYKQV